MVKSELPLFLQRYEKHLSVSYHNTKFRKNQKVIEFDALSCNKPKLGRNNKSRRRQPLIEHDFKDFELYEPGKEPGFYYTFDKEGNKRFVMKTLKTLQKRCIHLRDECILCSKERYYSQILNFNLQ